MFVSSLLLAGKTFSTSKVSTHGFIENKGQIIDQNNQPNPGVRYLYHSPGLNVQLRRTGFSYDVYNVKTSKRGYSDKTGAEGRTMKNRIPEMDMVTDTFYFHRVDIELAGADPGCSILAAGPSADYNNYYTTSTPIKGVTGVRSYDTVTYSNIYPGIDLQFHMTETGGFKSNFILHPGARLSEIKYRISGSEVLVSDKGSLNFRTTQGDVEEAIPECRVVSDQGSRIFQTRFIRLEENVYGFSTGEDIPSNATVIIDPSCMRVWGTYYGGSGQEFSTTALDSRSGMVLFGGTPSSSSVTVVWTLTGTNWISVIFSNEFNCSLPGPITTSVTVVTGGSTLTTTPLSSTVCSGDWVNVALTSTVTNTTYTWTASASSLLISGFLPGSGNTIHQQLFNSGIASGTVTYSITTWSGGCTGGPTDYVVTVNPLSNVNVTISSSANPVCSGSAVTFTAVPLNGGATPSYQWKVNEVSSGSNSPVFSYAPSNGDAVKCILVSSQTSCVSGNPATSNAVTMGISPSPFVSFSSCFDTMTTISAKPVLLRGAIPLGGIYSGPGVNSVTGYFNPSLAGTGVKTISYTYVNAGNCSNAKSLRIHVFAALGFTCGQALTDVRDGKTYTTVQLGSQCWMQKNLDYGTMTSAVNHQQDTIINGFRAKESGVIYSNASWKFQGFGSVFWTSTPSGSIKAISHGLNQINFSVSDYPANRSNAFATRCLRD